VAVVGTRGGLCEAIPGPGEHTRCEGIDELGNLLVEWADG
jgi:hypothetical protein